MASGRDEEISNEYEAYRKISLRFGAKAAGLNLLPGSWRLDFFGLSVDVFNHWAQGLELSNAVEIQSLKEWLAGKGFRSIILRSSGMKETLYDRGKFHSQILRQGWTPADIDREVAGIFEAARTSDPDHCLGIVVQEYLQPTYVGHLSNEHRVSPTINQWSYEIEAPQWAPAKGINSKFTTSPDPYSPLRCGNQIPHQPLRSVAHYLAGKFDERCHVEWFVNEGTLYLAQIDFEWPEEDIGLDPRCDIVLTVPPELNLDVAGRLPPYEIGQATKWAKLNNLSDFDFGDTNPPPRVHPLSPTDIRASLTDADFRSRLKAEMVALTGNRLVVRTDCNQDGVGHFNLPRTDTMSVDSALEWCEERLQDFERRGVSDDDFVFLFHAFLPARASAWAYAKPGNPIVIVDALWGLPDGLQVLPVDTYEVNVAKGAVVGTKSTFKPRFLTELEDGTWDYRGIKSRSARGQVLSKGDKLEIATRTRAIADHLGSEAQIMWFCGIPESYRVGKNLPWFRSREKFDPAPRQEVQYKPFPISTPADLTRVPAHKVTLQLMPDANLIRDEEFLDRIVEVAKSRHLPVQLEGSILGHAFYKLNQAGISIVLSNAPKYYRRRNRQVFGKLVRDKIPHNIVAGGEAIREARLARDDLGLGLAGKLVEEIEELLRSNTTQEHIAEIADILEVVKGLAHAYEVDWQEVERQAEEKAASRGGFRDGRILIETALPHRGELLERQAQVRLAELGRVDTTSSLAEIGAGVLMATTLGPGIIFSFENDPTRYRISMRQGKLQLTKLDQRSALQDAAQPDLFEGI